MITLYHNPACGTSRTVLGILREAGVEPHIIEYLRTPLAKEKLRELAAHMRVPVRELLRTKEAIYQELGLDNPALSEDTLLEAIAAHPALLNRPIVVAPKGACLCRRAEKVRELLG